VKFEGRTSLSSRVCQRYNEFYAYKVINRTAFNKKEVVYGRATCRDVAHGSKNNFPVFPFSHTCPEIKSKFKKKYFYTSLHQGDRVFQANIQNLYLIFLFIYINNWGSVTA